MLNSITKFFKKKNKLSNGARIRITWLPACKNSNYKTKNPYIGMEGVVQFFDGTTFTLDTGSSRLVNVKAKNCQFI